MKVGTLVSAALIGVLAAACDQLGISDTDDLSSITVKPNPATVLANGRMQFNAEGRYGSGKAGSIKPTWSVTPSLGSISSSGYFTAGARPGAGSVQARLDGVIGTAAVSVVSFGEGGSGSCPTVYSWDGNAWRLDSGTFGGAIARGLARTDIDNLEHAVAIDGVVALNVRNELDETDHIDAVSLLVVDHHPRVTVAPSSDGRIFGLRNVTAPIRAKDANGRDILRLVTRADGISWESTLSVRDTADVSAVTDPIEITFPRPRRAQHARLLITGQNTEWANEMLLEFLRAHGRELDTWYARVNSEPAFAQTARTTLASAGFLHVSLWTVDGWLKQGLVWEVGPELMKKQVVALDLRRAAPGPIRIRLEAPPSFWRIDHVALAMEDGKAFTISEVKATDSIIAIVDDRVKTIATGHGFQLAFNVPALPRGRKRTYMLSSTGWYRFNTPSLGEPNGELLRHVAAGPRAMQKASVGLLNDLIARAQSGS